MHNVRGVKAVLGFRTLESRRSLLSPSSLPDGANIHPEHRLLGTKHPDFAGGVSVGGVVP